MHKSFFDARLLMLSALLSGGLGGGNPIFCRIKRKYTQDDRATIC